jgi:xylose isomerase
VLRVIGYGERLTTEQLIRAATQVEGLTGVEVVGLWHVNDSNVEQIRKQIQDAGLEVTCVTPDIWASGKWGNGSFASNDPKIRRDAIQEVKKSMEWARQLNCEVIDLWFGQDGYDYPFQADYMAVWDRIIEGTLECAEYLPEVKIVLEYKPKEPRTHCFIATVGKTLLLIEKVNKPNVGAMIDVGHALMAYENVAESTALLQYFGGKLFYMHFNDNWRLWDDDMTVGSVHTIEMLELLYWLDRVNYNGWYALDIFPYRENGLRAASESIRWIQGLQGLVDRIGRERIGQVIASADAMSASEMIREALLG